MNLRSEIGVARGDLDLWTRRGEKFLARKARRRLDALINAPEIDLRPLPAEQPHPCPPSEPWID